MPTITSTLDSKDFTDFLSDFCGTRIDTVDDLARAAYLCGIQPSDILSAAQNLYQRERATA